jgi:hypothetical protein
MVIPIIFWMRTSFTSPSRRTSFKIISCLVVCLKSRGGGVELGSGIWQHVSPRQYCYILFIIPRANWIISRHILYFYYKSSLCIYLDINKQLILVLQMQSLLLFMVLPFDPSSFRFLKTQHITILFTNTNRIFNLYRYRFN